MTLDRQAACIRSYSKSVIISGHHPLATPRDSGTRICPLPSRRRPATSTLDRAGDLEPEIHPQANHTNAFGCARTGSARSLQIKVKIPDMWCTSMARPGTERGSDVPLF